MKLFKKKHTNLPEGTDELIPIENIKVPPVFTARFPRRWKITKAREYLNEHGTVDKPIIVFAETNEKGKDNKFILVDRFTRYLVLQEKGIKQVPVKYIDINAVHMKDNFKESAIKNSFKPKKQSRTVAQKQIIKEY